CAAGTCAESDGTPDHRHRVQTLLSTRPRGVSQDPAIRDAQPSHQRSEDAEGGDARNPRPNQTQDVAEGRKAAPGTRDGVVSVLLQRSSGLCDCFDAAADLESYLEFEAQSPKLNSRHRALA